MTQLAVQLRQLGFHLRPAGVGELANAGGAVLLGAQGRQHLQQHLAVVPAVQIHLAEIAGADDGHHGHLGLDGGMEGAGLER